MADNELVDNGALTDYGVATDKVTYSGNADQNVELMRPVHVTGSEGAKTVEPVTVSVTGGTAAVQSILTDSTGAQAFISGDNGLLVEPALGSFDVFASGAVAHDSPDSGNPVKIGGVGQDSAPANVSTDGDRVNAWFGRNGIQYVGIADSDGNRVLVDSSNGIALNVTPMDPDSSPGIFGNVAHDSPDSAYGPVKIGGSASAAAPASVDADGDRVNAWFLRNGAQATVVTAAGALIGGDATNGLDVDVTRLPALVAGSANIGDVDIASLPDEGQQTMANSISVAIASNQSAVPVADATAQGSLDSIDTNIFDMVGASVTYGADTYTEASTKALMVGAVRRDADTTLVGTTNEDAPLQVDASGRLKTISRIGDATLTAGIVDETGSSAVDALAVGGGTPHDSVDSGNPIKIGGKAETGTPSAVADGDRVDAWLDEYGRQMVGILSTIGDAGADGSNQANVAADGQFITTPLGAAQYVYNGTNWDRQRGDITNGALVNLGSNNDVVAGGDVAHGTGDSGNPVKIGMKAANALPTAEANNDRVNGIADLWGRQMTTHIDPAQQIHKAFNATSTQTGIDVWSPTSGKKIAVTSVVIGVYGTTAGRIILWFGDNADTTYTAGTDQVLLAFSAAPSANSKPGLVFTPAVPVFCTTADRELHITTDAAVSIDVTVEGYEW